jgi:pimeloyl-ACP methyl ester carboxylesterase
MKYTAYKLFKKPFFGRFMKPWRWPENIDRSQWQRLEIASTSGARISALLARAHIYKGKRQQPKGAVLMCHPMGVVAKGFWLKYGHAEMLRKAGYHVMVFDLNGFGESTSTTMDYPLDVLAAGLELQAQFPELPVAVYGSSMGAAMSVCAMAQQDHPFKVAILESAFPTLLHFWSRYPVPKLGIKLSKLIYPKGERSLRPLHAAQDLVGTPNMLMIYGEADVFTPVKDGKLLFNVLNTKTQVDFWSVPKAEHTHAFRTAPNEYQAKVIEFLDEHLSEQKKQ